MKLRIYVVYSSRGAAAQRKSNTIKFAMYNKTLITQ